MTLRNFLPSDIPTLLGERVIRDDEVERYRRDLAKLTAQEASRAAVLKFNLSNHPLPDGTVVPLKGRINPSPIVAEHTHTVPPAAGRPLRQNVLKESRPVEDELLDPHGTAPWKRWVFDCYDGHRYIVRAVTAFGFYRLRRVDDGTRGFTLAGPMLSWMLKNGDMTVVAGDVELTDSWVGLILSKVSSETKFEIRWDDDRLMDCAARRYDKGRFLRQDMLRGVVKKSVIRSVVNGETRVIGRIDR